MQDLELIKSISDDIYTITGINPVFYDEDMRLVYGRPDAMSDFCTYVRRDPTLTARCFACDREGLCQCRAVKDLYLYHCHMGLIEVIAPIIENGTVIGYIQFGQLSDEEDKHTAADCVRRSTLLPDKEAALTMLRALPVTDREVIRAEARVITMCASYARLHSLLKARTRELGPRLESYIRDHLADELTVPVLCRVFGISRATLYQIAKARFGLGISDYIREARVDEAITLLKSRSLTAAQVAEAVGVYDANYLTKLLKERTGKTARQIKKG